MAKQILASVKIPVKLTQRGAVIITDAYQSDALTQVRETLYVIAGSSSPTITAMA